LADDEPDVVVVARDEDRIRPHRLEGGQLGAEIGVALAVGLVGDDRASQLLEGGDEEVREPDRVIRAHVTQDARLLHPLFWAANFAITVP
jgi:hypothetical protein